MITGVSIATILVEDQDDAIEFYADTLGMELQDDEEMPNGDRWVTVAPEGTSHPQFTLVAADTDAKCAALGEQAGDHVLFSLETDDCRATYETLSERGVAFHGEPEDVPWGVSVVFEDPYGNLFDLVEVHPH